MRTVHAVALSVLFLSSAAYAANFQIPSYYAENDFLLAPAGAFGSTGLNGFVNPAALTYVDRPNVLFTWSDQGTRNWNVSDHWGLFFGLQNFAYGVVQTKSALGTVNDNRVSVGGGNKGLNFGLGYGWSNGDTAEFNRTGFFTLAALLRPERHLSLGLAGDLSSSSSETQLIADLGIRPFGNEKLTLFSDYALQSAAGAEEKHWSAGAAFEVLPGIRLTGRYFDIDAVTAGLNVSFGFAGAAVQGRYDTAHNLAYNTYAVQLGYDRTVFIGGGHHAQLELPRRIAYQRHPFFDESQTFRGLLDYIDRARRDDKITGLLIDASRLDAGRINGNTELLWELREKLKEFKAAGKEVIIYADTADMFTYYFATAANKIVLNPLGSVRLQGVRFGTYYFKDTLGKLGIGFDEVRLFKYKSAAEAFSRTGMSDADREQMGRLVRNYYDTVKDGICTARRIAPQDFETLVNDDVYFTADEALKKGLVDELNVRDSTSIVSGVTRRPVKKVSKEFVTATQEQSDVRWGPVPTVAVIYAVGPVAMDSGIRARQLAKDIEAASRDRTVGAVVFRVDSPGGDGFAADTVAEALRKCRAKKPVIVSQGFLAASGGYWISMHGDPIVASPLTITGSIGVLAGWFYNTGLKGKLGVSTDLVKVGAHADLGFGMPLPFVGSLPDRDLDPKERALYEHDVLRLYNQFVQKVASARGKEYASINAVAQGRIWTGEDAREKGLTDRSGGLDTALRLAKQKLKYPEDLPVRVVEYPQPALFNPQAFMPQAFGADRRTQTFIEHLKLRTDNNGLPMPILPLEFMDLDTESLLR